jgi:hypothetical protein
MSFVCVLDSINRNFLRPTVDYFVNKFDAQIISYDGVDDCIIATSVSDMLEQLHYRSPDLVLTNHLQSIPQLSKYKTLLWLTDGSIIGKRQENIQFWRQTMGYLKSAPVYAASQFISKQILDNYRLPTKVVYPYVSPNENSSNEVVYYNEEPVYLTKIKEQLPDQPFAKLLHYEDLQQAKLYIHVAVGLEYSNIEIPMAHSYGVPCVVETTGCLTEYITNGDRTIAVGTDEKQWLNVFRQALRDRNINSEIVKKLSFRYGQMADMEEKIKQALRKNNKTTRPPTFQEVQAIARKKFGGPPNRPIVEKPEKKHLVRPPVVGNGLPKNDVDHVKNYLDENDRVYFGCGGLGDAILTISCCYQDPDAKVIFGANHDSVKLLFDAFKIPALITRNFYPSMLGITLHNYIVAHPHFKGAAHIPDSMNYGEWISNHERYLKRLTTSMPLIDIFGKMINLRNTESVVGIAPRGSDHQNSMKQRYLTIDEFRKLATKLLNQNKTVFGFGSPADVDYYGLIQDNNFIWMTSEFGWRAETKNCLILVK